MSNVALQRKLGDSSKQPGTEVGTVPPAASGARDMVKGATFDEGSQMLAPGGALQMKREQGLSSAPPVQMEEASSGAPVITAKPDGTLPTAEVAAAEKVAPVADPNAATTTTPVADPNAATTTTPVADPNAPANAGKTESYGVKGGRTGYIQDKSGAWVPDPAAGGNRSYVNGTGAGKGDRKDDLEQWVDEKDHSKGKVRKNEAVTMGTITGVPTAELDKIAKNKEVGVGATGEKDSGAYATASTAVGTASGGDMAFSGKNSTADGKELSGPSAYYQKGAVADAHAGVKGYTEGAAGTGTAKLDAYGTAQAGLSGKVSSSDKGVSATGAIGAGVEVGVKGDADYKTPGMTVAGVEKPLDAGVGVHAEAKAYAKAGVGGGAYLTKEKIGVEGSIGAAAVAEAKVDVHGNIGPVAGKYEVGVLAGAGIGASGGIVYEDGKLRIGGRVYAALGYGVVTGGEVVIDLKQSAELGIALLKKARDLGVQGAEVAFKAADADGDGQLTLNDGATHASNAMNTGAQAVDSGVDGLIGALDGDGDGKFDLKKDGGARLGQAADYAKEKGGELLTKGGEMVDGAKKAVGDTVTSATKAVGDGITAVKDYDYAGAYERGKQVVSDKITSAGVAIEQGANDAVAYGAQKLEEGKELAVKIRDFDYGQAAKDAGNAAVDTGKDLYNKGAAAVDATGKAISSGVDATGKAIKSGVDATGKAISSGVDSAGKAISSGVETVKQTASAAYDKVTGITVADVQKVVSDAGTAVSTKVGEVKAQVSATAATVQKKVTETYTAVVNAPDLNGDGKIDEKDAAIAKQRILDKAAALKRQADAQIAAAKARALQAAADLEKKARETAAQVQASIEAAKVSIQAAPAKAMEYAKSAYNSADAAVTKAGATLSAGYNSAASTIGGAWDKAASFFGD